MPTIRGSSEGSKKRYAGMKGGELVFKGLENVRSDWTVLAKTFQYELYKKVFTGQPVEDYINSTIAAIKSGEMDHALVYKKAAAKTFVVVYQVATSPRKGSAISGRVL